MRTNPNYEPDTQDYQAEDAQDEMNGYAPPIIPPSYLIGLAIIGFMLAFGVWITQPTFSIIGWAGLGIGGLALLAWVLMAPEQLMGMVRGRAFAFGGTALLVSLVFFVALIAIYVVIRQQNWRVDYSQGDLFSLNERGIALVETLAADPTIPDVRFIGFYSTAQAGQRDRISVLLDDFVSAGEGKISYEFINPNRQPVLTEQYGVQEGQFVVVPLDENDEPLSEQAEIVDFPTQQSLAQALIRVTATGDYRAYFLTTRDSVPVDNVVGQTEGAAVLAEQLRNTYNWTVEPVSLLQLANPESDVQLGAGTDGEVLVLTGGNGALTDEQLAIITDYLDNGGSVAIFANFNPDGGPTIATADNMSAYLMDNFGLRINNDLVIDPVNAAFGAASAIYTENIDATHPITRQTAEIAGALIFELTHSIDIADTPPQNVTVTPLAFSGDASYAKSDVNFASADDTLFQQTADDPVGPLVLAAAAENTETGARLAVFGTQGLILDSSFNLQQLGVDSWFAGLNGILWAGDYDSLYEQLPTLISNDRPQDVPVFATQAQLSMVNFVSIIALPFGVLTVGIFMWLNRRERDARIGR